MTLKACSIVLVLISLILGGCSDESNKIPITSSSKEAIDNWIKGRDLLEKLRNAEAVDYFEKAIKADSGFAMAYLYTAYTQDATASFFESLNKAVSLVDKISEGERLFILAVQAGTNAKPAEQEQLLLSLVEKYPEDERAHNQLGTFYFGQQEFEKAIDSYKKSLEINSMFSLPYNMLGYCQWRLGNYEEAEVAFKKYIKLIPDDPNPYDSYAEFKMKTGDYGLSIESYYKALEVNPDFFPSHFGIAGNLNFLGKHKDARDQLQEIYDLADDFGLRRQALFNMAVSYADEGNLEAALETIVRQFKLAKKMSDGINMSNDLRLMSTILFEMGEWDDAFIKSQEAVKVIDESDFSEEIKANTRRILYYVRARVAAAKGDFKTAKSNADQYRMDVEKLGNPGLVRASHELAGLIALEQEDYELALVELQRSNLQNPYNIYRIAEAFLHLGNLKQAIDMYYRAANFNIVGSMNYAFIRLKAHNKYKSLANIK